MNFQSLLFFHLQNRFETPCISVQIGELESIINTYARKANAHISLDFMILQFHARGKRITGLSVKTVGFRFFFFFFFLRFLLFFPPLCTLVIHPVKYHGAKYVTRRFILRPRCNGTLGSRIAFVICTDEILRDSRNTKPFAPVSRKKGKKKKKKQRSINRRNFPWKPTKSRINRETRNLNPTAFTVN